MAITCILGREVSNTENNQSDLLFSIFIQTQTLANLDVVFRLSHISIKLNQKNYYGSPTFCKN